MNIAGISSNIAASSVNMAQASVMNKVGTAMLDKTLDMQKTTASGIVDMMNASLMELSVNPGVGSNFDARV
ncbi:MAG TPA: YjfB family protein [Lachnospiraceae bacterium]|nr:YjfB family protein [Lachnospiraceae bacterium]